MSPGVGDVAVDGRPRLGAAEDLVCRHTAVGSSRSRDTQRLRAPGQPWRALSIKVRTTSGCPDLIHVVNATIRANFLPLLALLI